MVVSDLGGGCLIWGVCLVRGGLPGPGGWCLIRGGSDPGGHPSMH